MEDGAFLFVTEVDFMGVYSVCRCWSLKTDLCVMALYGHTGTVNCLDVHADRLVSGAKDCLVKGEQSLFRHKVSSSEIWIICLMFYCTYTRDQKFQNKPYFLVFI